MRTEPSQNVLLYTGNTTGQTSEPLSCMMYTIFTFFCTGAGAGDVEIQASPNPTDQSPTWVKVGELAPNESITLQGIFPAIRAKKDATGDAKVVYVCRGGDNEGTYR